MRRLRIVGCFALVAILATGCASAQQLGSYLGAHGFVVTSWGDFTKPGLPSAPEFGRFDPTQTDISTYAKFNARYGGGVTVNLTCGPNWTQGAGTPFRAANTPAACIAACPCKDGTCAVACTDLWLPPFRAKGYGSGELASYDQINAFFRKVGIPGSASYLDWNDILLVQGAYRYIIAATGTGGTVTPNPPPVTVPPVVNPPTAPSCDSWAAAVLSALRAAAPAGCSVTLPAGSVAYRPGILSTGSAQLTIVPD